MSNPNSLILTSLPISPHLQCIHTSLHSGINVGDVLAGLHREGVGGSRGKVRHLRVHRAVTALEGRRELEPVGHAELHGVRPGQHIGEVVEAVDIRGGGGHHHTVLNQLHSDPGDAGLVGVLDAVAVQVLPNTVPNRAV